MVKLGADHLPPGFDSPVDRKVATAPHMALVRLRMQQIARLLAEALLAPLARAPDAPLHLVNIAGGPALDSINALIILARAHAMLIRRPIAIHVFDARQDGPSEGGLFEYGTDDAVVTNLSALARGGVPIVAGSVTSSSELRKRMIAQARFRLFPRGLEGFAPLAERSGYVIAESRTAVVSEQVLLRPRAAVLSSQ